MNTGHEDLTSGLKMSRRSFLQLGVAAAAVGAAAALKLPGSAAADVVYTSSPSGQWSKLSPTPDYASASVRFVENNSEWLGTSKIVGPIKNPSEYDMGFNQAARGLIDDRARRGVLTFVGKHPLSAALSDTLGMIGSEAAVYGPPSETGKEKYPIPDPEQMSRHIKDLAYFLRADEVGIGKMPAYAYYSERTTVGRPAMLKTPPEESVAPFEERLPYVIVFMVDQNLKTVQASTGYDGISASQSFLAYHATGYIAVIVAKYIRSLGYEARAHHARNYGAAMPPCAIAAGLGEFIRPGESVAHPRLGFRVKLAAVTTDMPLVPDKPIDFGMQDFCKTCMKCADNCPSGAITHDSSPVEHNGYLRWNSDSTKCTVFRTTNEEGSSCGRCMKVCPWNSKEDSWFHQAGTWIGSRGQGASKFLKSLDDVFGYGEEQIEKYKWWLDWPDQYLVPPEV